MELKYSEIQGLIEIFPKLFEDERGYFFEAFNEKTYKENNLNFTFVQDNQSFSKKGVLRGLHFQEPPYAQGKLVRVLKGKVLDVAVDIRKSSPTFGKHEVFELNDIKNNALYIPEGFAHGFLACEDTVLMYKCTNFYNKESENGIIWNDPDLNINWNIDNPYLSHKDLHLPSFQKIINDAVPDNFS